MIGTVLNVFCIIIGGLIGLQFKGSIPENYSKTVTHAIGLAVLLIGIKSALQTDALLVVVISLALGSLLGEWLRIEEKLNHIGLWIGSKYSKGNKGIAQGFVSASLLYCAGAMSIIGAMESGLTGNHQTLFAKSVLDGISSVILASTLGMGVLFSALSVLVFQGLITVTASSLKPLLTQDIVSQMSAVGGLLIVAIGIGLLDGKKLKVGNMLPAIFLPLIYKFLQQIPTLFQ